MRGPSQPSRTDYASERRHWRSRVRLSAASSRAEPRVSSRCAARCAALPPTRCPRCFPLARAGRASRIGVISCAKSPTDAPVRALAYPATAHEPLSRPRRAERARRRVKPTAEAMGNIDSIFDMDACVTRERAEPKAAPRAPKPRAPEPAPDNELTARQLRDRAPLRVRAAACVAAGPRGTLVHARGLTAASSAARSLSSPQLALLRRDGAADDEGTSPSERLRQMAFRTPKDDFLDEVRGRKFELARQRQLDGRAYTPEPSPSKVHLQCTSLAALARADRPPRDIRRSRSPPVNPPGTRGPTWSSTSATCADPTS